MGQPAARVGDMHVCPMVTPGVPPIPHVGGPILPPGGVTVMIGGVPAARMGDMCVCVGPPDVIAKGSMGVFIMGMPAARMGDLTAHGGSIVIGLPTVLIGETMPGAPPVVVPPVVIVSVSLSQKEVNSAKANAIASIIKSQSNSERVNRILERKWQILTAKNSKLPFCKKCNNQN